MSDAYEVVIAPADGSDYDRDHARLLRERLLADGFRDDAVTVREVTGDE